MRNMIMFRRMALLVLGIAGLATSSQAQVFNYNTADLCICFRQDSASYSGTNEDVLDGGQASNYVNLAVGTTISVPNLSPSQLYPWSLSSFQNLQWSVTAYFLSGNYPGYPNYTLWVTVPRTDVNVQTTPPTRLSTGVQKTAYAEIESIFFDAQKVSQAVAISNQFNTPFFVQESDATYPTLVLSQHMGDLETGFEGTLQDTWPDGNLEITTPNSFSGFVRSDFYEVRPLTDSHGNPIVDPHVGTNSGAYFVGYFQLNSSGAMTFTRAASSSGTPPEPPAPTLKISRSGNTSTISFGTTNAAIYTLFYTDSAGLAQPTSAWPSNAATITGNGSTQSFTDTTAATNRFYRVGAQ